MTPVMGWSQRFRRILLLILLASCTPLQGNAVPPSPSAGTSTEPGPVIPTMAPAATAPLPLSSTTIAPTPVPFGGLRWRFTQGDVNSVTLQDGRVFVGSSRSVYALDAQTGQVLWWQDLGGSTTTFIDPILATDTVLFAIKQSQQILYALNVRDGAVLWVANLREKNNYYDDGLLAVSADIVLASTSHYLYALAIADGLELWAFMPEEEAYIQDVVAAEGRVFVSTSRGLYALDTRTGQTSWKMQRGETGSVGSLAFTDGALYAELREFPNLPVARIDPSTGAILAEFSCQECSSVALYAAEGGLFALSYWVDEDDHPSHRLLHRLDPETLAEFWNVRVDRGVDAYFRAGTVFFTTQAGKVYAVDAATGRYLWTLDFKPDFIDLPPLVTENELLLYVDVGLKAVQISR